MSRARLCALLYRFCAFRQSGKSKSQSGVPIFLPTLLYSAHTPTYNSTHVCVLSKLSAGRWIQSVVSFGRRYQQILRQCFCCALRIALWFIYRMRENKNSLRFLIKLPILSRIAGVMLMRVDKKIRIIVVNFYINMRFKAVEAPGTFFRLQKYINLFKFNSFNLKTFKYIFLHVVWHGSRIVKSYRHSSGYLSLF